MTVKQLYDTLEEYVSMCPDAVVRMEVFDKNSAKGSHLNKPCTVCISSDHKKITIVGDGEPQPY